MSFTDLTTRFKSILNRDDCTDAQAQIFITDAISRVQRDCRIPSMERQLLVTAQSNMDFITVPPDLLQIIDLMTTSQDGVVRPLQKLSYRQLMGIPPTNWPCAYARLQGQLWVRGQVQTGQVLQLIYYGEFSPFATPASDNEISGSNPDLVVYAALSFAGDVFEHPATDRWETRYQQILSQVQGLASDLENSGGPATMAPFYGDWQ